MAILLFGTGTICNLNYLASMVAFDRLHDAEFVEMDLAIYQRLGASSTEPLGMFPVFKSRLLFDFLENNYMMLYPEIFIAILVVLQMKGNPAYLLGAVFACYFLGVAIFIVYPTIGPCFVYPDLYHSDYRDSHIYAIMQPIVSEYLAVKNNASGVGTAYFIGLPSLHVAKAVLFQVFLASSPIHFWCFLPINLFLALSTFLLGVHYFLDFPAGVLLALLVLTPGWYWQHRKTLGRQATA
jgi:membrane-associated phospholipid phosphatase